MMSRRHDVMTFPCLPIVPTFAILAIITSVTTHPSDTFAGHLVVRNHREYLVFLLVLAVELGPRCAERFCNQNAQLRDSLQPKPIGNKPSH